MLNSIYSLAQDQVQLVQSTWSISQIDFDLPKKWSASLNHQLRTRNLGFDNTFTELEIEKALTKEISVGVGCRLIALLDIEDGLTQVDPFFRWHYQAAYEYGHEQFEFKIRYRKQRRNELGVSKLEGDYPRSHDRLKLSMSIKFDDFKLNTSYEIFRRTQLGTLDGISENRLGFGLNHKINKRSRFDLIYYSELTNEIWEPTLSNIFVARFRYKIDLD
ncbi:MAG: DUF2490 domain-containing protein [Bacteroidia bacterium]